jgi:glycosyltransferase involved in cell wall biosynthesis
LRNASVVRLRELGTALIAAGVRVTYVIDDVAENRRGLGLDEAAEAHLVGHAGSPLQFLERRRLLRRLEPDFVHVIDPARKTCLALIGTRFRVIGDWDEWPVMRDHPLATKVVERILDAWLRRRAWLTIVASRFLQGQFQERHGLTSTYVPYAIPSSGANAADGDSPFLEPTAVYMGNLYADFDHDVLFEAALLLKRKGLTPRLAILGQGPELNRWRRFAAENDLSNVTLPGYVDGPALWRHLRHAHVLLFPIRATVTNLARCPSKSFSYARASRPVITNELEEVHQVLGPLAQYIHCSPEAFADALKQAFASPRPGDVHYDLTEHTWDLRARVLLSAVRAKGSLPD